jgi:hypothetical protein
MGTKILIFGALLLAACADPQPPCQDQICVQQRQIDAYRRAALLEYSAKMLAPPPQPTRVYVWRNY